MTRKYGDPWNKKKRVGARRELTPKQVSQIQINLSKLKSSHDLCLFTVAIDTMLRAENLLQLKVGNVTQPDGGIAEMFPWKQNKSSAPVFPVLTPTTQKTIQSWIFESGKQPEHYLFTRGKPIDGPPITAGFYREIIKAWVEEIGLFSDNYSGHSFRRTKAISMFEGGVPIVIIGRLLGHKTEAATLHYLGITNAVTRKHAIDNDIFKNSNSKKHFPGQLDQSIDIVQLARKLALEMKKEE